MQSYGLWQNIIDKYLAPDSGVSEIATNGTRSIFFRKDGRRVEIENFFKSMEEYNNSIDELVTMVNKNRPENPEFLEEGSLYLSDGKVARCHIVLPPASIYPLVTIARKTTDLTTLEDIAYSGSMTTKMKNFLQAAVECRLTMVLSGSTGAGKDLHKDTIIPTPFGLKTMGDISVGDLVYDENGEQTKVLTKYAPLDETHYEIVLSNGEVVKAGQGHLWKVVRLDKYKKFSRKRKALIHDEDYLRESLEYSRGHKKLVTIKDFINSIEVEIDEDEVEKFILEDSDLFCKSYKVSKEKLEAFAEHNDEIKNALENESSKGIPYEVVLKSLSDDVLNSKDVIVLYKKEELLMAIFEENKRRFKKEKRRAFWKDRPVQIMTTQELYDEGVMTDSNKLRFAINKLSGPTENEHQELPIDPYTLGAWLGDGYSSAGRICGIDDEVFEKISDNEIITSESLDKNNVKTIGVKDLKRRLKEINVLDNKHIPTQYKIADENQRKELISGLLDTDGFIDIQGICYFDLTEKTLVEDIREVVASLGIKVSSIKVRKNSYKNELGEKVECKDSYMFSFISSEFLPLVKRKRERILSREEKDLSQQDRHSRIYIKEINIIKDFPEDYYCIGVESPTKMFLFGKTHTPTHNTTLLESLTKMWPDNARIGVVEDAPELALIQPNVFYLKSSVAKPGVGENQVATLQWCVAQLNRMRVDLIVIGETRGSEFANFLTAANSGCEGSLTTIHASEPRMALQKMNQFVNMAYSMPQRTINQNIANTIDIIIQLNKTIDGKYRCTSIEQVTTQLSNDDSATIALSPLFTYQPDSDTWKSFKPTDQLRELFMKKGYNEDFVKEAVPQQQTRGLGAGYRRF